jgi:DNA-binding beta-propeller fold protein YncE
MHLAFRSSCQVITVLLLAVAGEVVQARDGFPVLLESEPAYRVPVDVVWQRDRLFVANSRTGTVSCLDPESRRVTTEWAVAESLSGMAGWREGLLMLDDRQHRLIRAIWNQHSGNLESVFSLEVPQYPVDIAVSADERIIAVSSLWSRQLTLLDAQRDSLRIQHVIDLPFAPRSLMFLLDGSLAVADAFGGQLAIMDSASGKILKQHEMYGHNIRGLGLNRRDHSLLVTCQTLDPGTFTSYERIFWGVLMQNRLHSLPSAQLLSKSDVASHAALEGTKYDGSSYASQQRYPLGTPSIGSGDPGAMVVTDNDTTLLLISGVNQVAFRTASHLPFERLPTGRRPESICLDQAQARAFIANRFDDTITVISLAGESPSVESTMSLGTRRALTPAEQGEQTFYDATVSLDGWFSCHSCHTDGHTNGQRADTFGDEDRGAPKKVVSLLGTGSTGPWAWNGSKSQLEEQIKTSLIISMQTQIPSEQLPIEQLAAYLRSLPPAPSIHDARRTSMAENVHRRAVQEFDSIGCRNCHAGEAFTSHETFDVGIHDEMGETLFNPPSLPGVSQRAPYFHDGRAMSLEDVLKSSHHDSGNPLTAEQVQRLKELLETL